MRDRPPPPPPPAPPIDPDAFDHWARLLDAGLIGARATAPPPDAPSDAPAAPESAPLAAPIPVAPEVAAARAANDALFRARALRHRRGERW